MNFRTIAAGLAACFLAGALVYRFALPAASPGDPAASSGDLAASEARTPPQMTFAPVFQPCAHCHEVGEGARTSSGPVLNGVVGSKAAAREDYPYSDALRGSGIVWTPEMLRRFLESPGAVVPGTRMMVGGFTDDEIAPIIEFLETTPPSS